MFFFIYEFVLFYEIFRDLNKKDIVSSPDSIALFLVGTSHFLILAQYLAFIKGSVQKKFRLQLL